MNSLRDRSQRVSVGETAAEMPPAPIDLTKTAPEQMLWKWCETEELLGARGSLFPAKFSPSTAQGDLDTRLHDWVQKQIAAFQHARRLQGLNLFRLVRKRVWKDVGEFRFCEHPAEQQAFDRALRFMGSSRDGLIESIFGRLCEFLGEAAGRDGTV